MEKQAILDRLMNAIIDGDNDRAKDSALEAIKVQIHPLEAVEQGLSRGMYIVGERFESGESFLPELLMAADTFNAAMEVLQPELESQKTEVTKLGKVILGSVKGDVHSIGKNIVGTVLSIHGVDVVDMGVDVPSLNFIQEAETHKADIIALSAIMTTTMPSQREVIEMLKDMNLRDKYFVIVGGGPITEEWSNEIGSDGCAKSAVASVELVKKLLSKKG